MEQDGSPGCQPCFYIKRHEAGVNHWLSTCSFHVPEQNIFGYLNMFVSLMSYELKEKNTAKYVVEDVPEH